MSVRILLINPPFNVSKSNYNTSISVGLLSLASFLDKHGIEARIIDGVRQENYLSLIKMNLRSVDLIGISVMTVQTESALEISRMIKKLDPDMPVVWGGIHPTLFPKETADHPFVDAVVVGEGEQTLLDLILAFRGQKEFKEVDGIAFKSDKKVTLNKPREFLKTDYLPLPKWSLMPEEILQRLTLVPAYTSRGCPHRCTFCVNSITKNRWRGFSAGRVMTMLSDIRKQSFFKNKPIRFWDENFFTDIERSRKIIQGIIDQRWIMPWETTVRADYVKDGMIDSELLNLAKKSGCYLLSFGAESGSDRILKMIKKDVTADQIVESAKKTLRFGIIPQYSFMVGLPHEDKSDMKKTIDVIDRLVNLSDKVQILGPQAFRPYPGSILYEECIKSGWQSPKTLDAWARAIGDELNYLSPRKFPWLRDHDLVESLEAYVRFGAHSIKSAMGSTVKSNKVLKLLFVLVCKLRWKFKFFKWPLEFKIARKFIVK